MSVSVCFCVYNRATYLSFTEQRCVDYRSDVFAIYPVDFSCPSYHSFALSTRKVVNIIMGSFVFNTTSLSVVTPALSFTLIRLIIIANYWEQVDHKGHLILSLGYSAELCALFLCLSGKEKRIDEWMDE